MTRQAGLIICLTYCLSLIIAGLLGFPQDKISPTQWGSLLLLISLITTLATLTLPRYFYRLPTEKFWIAMGILAIISVIYLQLRLPQPSQTDISRILTKEQPYETVTVTGKTLSSGQETASKKIQLWLKAKQVTTKTKTKSVTGKVYVTLPLSTEKPTCEKQDITITGRLYQPTSPTHSSGFNFKQYLERQGSFVGLKGEEISLQKEPFLSWCSLRNRIVNHQKAWIPKQEAALISSMVLGRRSVNLPYELKDLFISVGMAHIVAASGFHVTLLLGLVLYITRYLSPEKQLILGSFILFVYIGLTGFYPSIVRASFMGIAVLIGATVDRKKDTLNSLLLAATLLLLFNPLWIQDLGFQLSFLATFGLLVSSPTLRTYFDFLPPRIASFMVVPLAAALWTFPFLIYKFSFFILYAIPINIITSPLIYLISLGGMISAVLGLIIPPLGSAIAWLLYYPTHWLISLATFVSQLPGNQQVIGQQPIFVILIIYSIYLLIWLFPWFKKKWGFFSIFIIALLTLKPLYNDFFVTQITFLSAKPEPMVIIQDRGNVTLLNYSNQTTNKYTLMPFLLEQKIDQLDCVVKVGTFPYYDKSCLSTNNKLPSIDLQENPNNVTNELQPFTKNQSLTLGKTQLTLLSKTSLAFQFKLKQTTGLWLLGSELSDNFLNTFSPPDILLWSGDKLSYDILDWLKGKTAIAYNTPLSDKRRNFFKKYQIDSYSLITDGSIQWTTSQGIIVTRKIKK
ncbi:MAG: ComEC/Rec2 family competence protein [Microcystaceae cyanobacterium]